MISFSKPCEQLDAILFFLCFCLVVFLKESDLLRYNICTIKLTILSVKIDDFCIYSCTSLLPCYRTFLSYTKVPSYLYAVNSFLHVTWPLETTDAFSTPIVSPFLGFYMNAIHSVYFILGMVYHSAIVCSVINFFYWKVVFPYKDIPQFNNPPVEGFTDNCFQILTIINKPAINIHIQIFV